MKPKLSELAERNDGGYTEGRGFEVNWVIVSIEALSHKATLNSSQIQQNAAGENS